MVSMTKEEKLKVLEEMLNLNYRLWEECTDLTDEDEVSIHIIENYIKGLKTAINLRV